MKNRIAKTLGAFLIGMVVLMVGTTIKNYIRISDEERKNPKVEVPFEQIESWRQVSISRVRSEPGKPDWEAISVSGLENDASGLEFWTRKRDSSPIGQVKEQNSVTRWRLDCKNGTIQELASVRYVITRRWGAGSGHTETPVRPETPEPIPNHGLGQRAESSVASKDPIKPGSDTLLRKVVDSQCAP
jgi:hypothetical protein